MLDVRFAMAVLQQWQRLEEASAGSPRFVTLSRVLPFERLLRAAWPVVCLLTACVPEERPGGATGSVSVEPVSLRTGQSFRSVPRKTDARATPSRIPMDGPAEPFSDGFDRKELGPDYLPTSGVWQLRGGRLCGEGARNRPVWLRHPLGTNGRIEFDATSYSDAGDLKVEVFGDGRSFAHSASYTDATGYVLIYGGWKNSWHVLARLNEHGKDRLERRTDPSVASPSSQPVIPGRTYHYRIERRDSKTLRWLVDGVVVHELLDPEPLTGPEHRFFAFNTWTARVCFDNLEIVPLGS